MQRRLLLVTTLLIVCLVAALAVPLALAYSSHRTGRLLLARRADATRFAELTDRAIREGDSAALAAEVSRYSGLYGAAVEIRDRDGRLLAGGGVDDTAAAGRALSGRITEGLPLLTPLGPSTVLIAEPAGRDAQVSGVVLLRAPTTAARRAVGTVWAVLAAGSLAALGCSLVAARRLSGWILRPVGELDRTTRAIAEGRLEARIGLMRGPVELRRLEEQFNTMADAISAALERQRAFVADASHELRTPLTVLSLRLENLEPHLTPAGQAEYEETLAELDRLAALLEDLLTLARVEADAGLTGAGPSGALRERLTGWKELYAAKGLSLTVDLSDDDSPLPAAVARIADIALDNAAKFVPSGGQVTVTLAEHVLTVADNGPGLDAAGREAALGRFWRAPDQSNVPGSGLGLAIAAELARTCGATLTLLPNTPHGLIVELHGI
ncbi:HAMP domain-containing sensor histidine kinase [Kitasatospora sp. GP82]|uniref:sensor histidine kinase n=1 Tax=Kitasatospora sp. GP82 TaxID=3035089 RepID=UPI0024767355|nr:HAMP domain-containing sensor histidine kinase [Kitasatospora sp. GP82]MDH6124103.1 signal transduction histidine kinase [Kitasatospora sp. GP82]